jgi:hypothetical protein
MSPFTRYIFLCLIALSLSLSFLAPLHARAQSHYINADDQSAEDDADVEAAPPAAHSIVVTSIQKCYAQLSHEEVLDIESNFVKPYEECKKRLAIKLKKKNSLKAGEQKEPAAKKHKPKETDGEAQDQEQAQPPADETQAGAQDDKPPSSGGFYRVQKNSLPAGRKPPPDNNTAPEAPPAPPPPQPKVTTYSFNR